MEIPKKRVHRPGLEAAVAVVDNLPYHFIMLHSTSFLSSFCLLSSVFCLLSSTSFLLPSTFFLLFLFTERSAEIAYHRRSLALSLSSLQDLWGSVCQWRLKKISLTIYLWGFKSAHQISMQKKCPKSSISLLLVLLLLLNVLLQFIHSIIQFNSFIHSINSFIHPLIQSIQSIHSSIQSIHSFNHHSYIHTFIHSINSFNSLTHLSFSFISPIDLSLQSSLSQGIKQTHTPPRV